MAVQTEHCGQTSMQFDMVRVVRESFAVWRVRAGSEGNSGDSCVPKDQTFWFSLSRFSTTSALTGISASEHCQIRRTLLTLVIMLTFHPVLLALGSTGNSGQYPRTGNLD